MVIILLIGFLLLLGTALMVLDATIEHADEGYEDNLGFHQESHHWTADPAPVDSGINLWDQVEGACCPLDMTPVLRPIQNRPPFTSNKS